MKLGVSYIVFDGTELLDSSIRQIREHVDFIQVIYQTKSWFGDKMHPSSLAELKKLERTGLIDKLTLFNQFKVLNDKSNRSIAQSKGYERSKRQLGLNTCVTERCSHYLCMDADEFYIKEEFGKAKELIYADKIDSTAVKFVNYVNIPTLHRGVDSSHVPFICRITGKSRMGNSFQVRCDPTRGITPFKDKKSFKLLGQHDIKMHHMETIRRDLKLKYEATTRSIFNRSRTDELVSNIKLVNENNRRFGFNKIIFPGTPETSLTKVDNIFKIPYKTW